MSHETVEGVEQTVVVLEVAQVVGPRGPAGENGADGQDGAPGERGPEGPRGAGGPRGADGPRGLPGTPGVDGTEGPRGPAGDRGLDGPEGPRGEPGRDGTDGAAGEPGRDGTDGRDGEAGPPGTDGLPGTPGRDGLPGTPGRDGTDGLDGTPGIPGAKGDRGPAGAGVLAGGQPGQVLAKTTGIDFDTQWIDVGTGGGPGGARDTTTFATSTLAAGATDSDTVSLAPSYRLLRVAASRPARVRLYSSAAKRDADLARPIGERPTGDHGRMAEFIFTTELPALDCSPSVFGFVADNTGDVPYSITSTSPAGGAVTVALLWIPTE
ncbi:hypothetical protein [Sanguibacter inulinus]|uniref:Collagen-like protein n=1 Tax=Sanguibacter inulinus TaxID=60922 RepID=A0A853EXP1_9MICO|nr:hypothetical protein [Sanguibacter inulinus]MBF0724076.1 hypothetical protein [Sanguibacter inulinus]NYS95221.1 hypothetical protein [Sanguibacter inulinus]